MLNGLFQNSKGKYISREDNVIRFDEAKKWHISSPFKKFYREKQEREQDIKKFTSLLLCDDFPNGQNLPYFDNAIEELLSNEKFLNDIIV